MVENNENHCRRAEKDGQSIQIAVGNHRDDVVCGVVDTDAIGEVVMGSWKAQGQ